MHEPVESILLEIIEGATRRHSANGVAYYNALLLIADIAEGSTTANSLPHIARIARKALTNGQHGGGNG